MTIRAPSKSHIVKAKADLVLAAALAFADAPNDETGAEWERAAVEYRDAIHALSQHDTSRAAAMAPKPYSSNPSLWEIHVTTTHGSHYIGYAEETYATALPWTGNPFIEAGDEIELGPYATREDAETAVYEWWKEHGRG